MNILILADYRAPNSGNFIASLLELAHRMRREAGDVVFLFPEHRDGGGYSWAAWLEREGFRVYLLNDKTAEQEKISVLQEIIRKHNIQIIHSHFGLYHKLLIQKGRSLGVKVIFHDHMDYVTNASLLQQRLHTLSTALVYRLCGIGVVSVMEKKHKDYWCCPKRWYVPNGLSLRRNVPVELGRQERRMQLRIDRGDKLCLFLGWDMYRKGLDVAIKAIDTLRQTDPSWHLGLVGFGSTPSQTCQDWIRNHTGIDPKSPWLHYFPSTEDMFSYHRAADVYLSTSRAEAFSYGLLEAISQDIPVVVSDIEGTSWAQAYNKCTVYPVEDSDACGEAIRKALAFSGDLSNSADILDCYSIERWCERVIAVYREMFA